MKNSETIYFGGGCFWCLEASSQHLPGIVSVTSGYAGGDTPNPSYEDVCSGTTGHAEVVEVVYDPVKTTLHKLLQLFFTVHDPSQLNRQGNDVGPQYRSIVLYTNESQRNEINKYIMELKESGKYPGVVTEVVPLDRFYKAEEYHQNYFAKNPEKAYCQLVVAPKVAKAKEFILGKRDQ